MRRAANECMRCNICSFKVADVDILGSKIEKMGELMFNSDHGYLEALVRGFKGGILTHADYANLVQCETLEGVYPVL
jgi:hypothetical protein